MCDTCPVHIPGPGEVAGGVVGAAVGAAMSKPGKRVLFWSVCIPALPFALWNELHWWVLAPVVLLAVGSAAVLGVMRVFHRSVVQAHPELTYEMRAALAARGLKPIPAPGQRKAQPALPRAMVRSLSRRRQALPAAQKALPAAEKVIVGVPVPAPARRAGR